MRYVGKTPRDDVNVSPEHPLVEAGTLVLGIGIVTAVAVLLLVLFVDVVLFFVPAATEVRLFEDWIPDDVVVIDGDDPRQAEVVELLGRMAAHWPETDYRFRAIVQFSDDVNAVALPGGLIIVTTGLLDAVESENELAFVLGHELGHFRNRDHIRGLGRGVLLGIAFAAATGKAGDASLGTTVADVTLRRVGREQELDADAFGLGLVNAEYGHVAGAADFFARQGGANDRVADWFATHPSPANRVGKLASGATQNGYRLQGETLPLPW